MYGGAALTAGSFVYLFAMLGTLRQVLLDNARQQAGLLSEAQIDRIVQPVWDQLITQLVLAPVITVALWCWMAVKNYRGRKWARVTATIFFGIYSVSQLRNLFGALEVEIPASLIIVLAIMAVLVWIVGLVAVVLLWRPESSAYYERSVPLRV